MTNIELLHRDPLPTLRNVRTVVEAEQDTFWCYMHPEPRNGEPRTRPCFSASLLEDLASYQGWAAQRIEHKAADTDQASIAHVVLASDRNVFNVGGDLALFARLIRMRDRKTLLDYAYRCIDVAMRFHRLADAPVHTIAVVQGAALGGGFEAALCCNTLIAERGASMGFPEVLFDLFPGMGAYSFLSRRIAPHVAERMMLDGRTYFAEELYAMGAIDILVGPGEGIEAARELIKRNRRTSNARRAMHKVRDICAPVTRAELDAVTEVWVDAALALNERALATMDRLVRAQQRRFVAESGTEEAAGRI